MQFRSIPKNDGFVMIPEFEINGPLWLLMPTRPDNWRDHAIPVQAIYMDLIETLSKYMIVNIGIENKKLSQLFKQQNKNIRIKILEYDDAWFRDTGPIFLKDHNRNIRAVKWGFNAWGGVEGGLYASWEKDDLLGERLCLNEFIDYYKNEMILEGGSVLTDGLGTLYTTESCLLNKNRNPNMTKREIEKNLRDYLGINKIVWIPEGLQFDETGGHVDNVCMLADNRRILLHWTNDKTDPQFRIVREAKRAIETENKSDSYNYEIIKILSPSQIPLTEVESKGILKVKGTYSRNQGDYVISSYVNAYQNANLVVVPQFGDVSKDYEALILFKKIYPSKRIIPFPAREIIIGGGGLHCITLGLPK